MNKKQSLKKIRRKLHRILDFINEELGDTNNNTKPKALIGNSWRRALSAEKGYTPDLPLGLLDYEEKVIQSGVNYVRHDAVADVEFVKEHVDRMNANGICVELTLFDEHEDFGYDWGNPMELADALKNNDVIFEVGNEFLNDNQAKVDNKKAWCERLRAEDVDVSCGAWGNSEHGDYWASQFKPIESANKYITVHRPYPPLETLIDYIAPLRWHKKLLWNEVLPHSIPDGELEVYVRGALTSGMYGVNVYGDEFEMMGRICKEYNG